MRKEDIFEKIRVSLMDQLEDNPDLEDEKIQERIDDLILNESCAAVM